MTIHTDSRIWVRPRVSFTAKAWGIVTIDRDPSGRGFRVTAVVAYHAPSEAIGDGELLAKQKASVDVFRAAAE